MSISSKLRASFAFSRLEKHFDSRDSKILSGKGIEVSLLHPSSRGVAKANFLFIVSFALFLFSVNLFIAYFNLFVLVTFPLFPFMFMLFAVALSVLAFWLAGVALLFRRRFVPCSGYVWPLERLLRSNGLYRSRMEKTKDGMSYEQIISSARLRLFRDDSMLTIRVYDDANGYTSKISKLEDMGLCAVVGRPLDSKKPTPCYVDYLFKLTDDTRIQAVPRLLSSKPSGMRNAIPLSGQLSWNFVKLPHMLIAGGTGGGKSTFIYYLIAEFLRLGDKNGGAADVYICDPKNAELASLTHIFGSDRVGVSPAQIAKIVRLCREEMDRRYEYMQDPKRFRFGADAFSYGLNPVFLIFDEVAAFKAGADKKTFAEVWDNLTQLVLKARASNVFVILALQQPRAESISTNIRDNLGARVSLGTLSSEGYRMTFGTSFDFLPIEGKGTGYIMLETWSAPRPFKAPFADYSKVDYLKELKRLYTAAQRRNGHTSKAAKKKDSEGSLDIQDNS